MRDVGYDARMRRLESAFQRLDKMLVQEMRQQCADQLVMGGLGAYVTQRWQHEADAEAVNDEERALVGRVVEALAAYATMEAGQRQGAVSTCRALLDELKTRSAGREPVSLSRPSRTARFVSRPPQGEAAQPAPAEPGKRPAVAEEPRAEEAAAVVSAVPIKEERPVPARPPRPAPSYGLDGPVTTIPGVNVGYAAKLAKLGVRTVRDLLYLFPRRYNDFTSMKRIAELSIGAVETVVGTVMQVSTRTTRNNKVLTEVSVADETGSIQAVWFGQAYLSTVLRKGMPIVLSGKVDVFLGRKVMQSPEYETLETQELVHTARLVPVYPLTEGLGARWMRRLQKRVVDRWAPQAAEFMPPSVRERARLMALGESLAQMHFPNSADSLAEARRRLAFDELFLLQIGLLQRRRSWQDGVVGTALTIGRAKLEQIIAALPFALTGAQRRALESILADIQQSKPMVRLLQGDVGSGKTVVALLAMLVVVANGYQAAIMAPTEILAQQHFKTIVHLLAQLAERLGSGGGMAGRQALFATAGDEVPERVDIPALPMLPSGVHVARLIGSLSDASKRDVRDALAAHQIDVVVGTHALIEESVAFDRLAFAVIDEQHRFGVMQRAALRQKGINPHVLVMTATPIPRTLALTLYGDLDIATIDELPPGRQVVKTKWLEPRDRERAYNFIRRQVQDLQHQAFVICPLIEESETIEAKAAVEEYDRLRRQVFPDLRVGLVHGRMKGQEKDEVMSRFAAGELDILVSTSVVEVGIDVPNATVMLIEGANRFGLAQLHQFRGRVGRGTAQSYCVLLADESGATADQRLAAIETNHDGFKLAEIDLEIRGPGEFFGTRQSGMPDLRVAQLSDMALLEQARAEALALFRGDPNLSHPDHRLLAEMVRGFSQRQPGQGDA